MVKLVMWIGAFVSLAAFADTDVYVEGDNNIVVVGDGVNVTGLSPGTRVVQGYGWRTAYYPATRYVAVSIDPNNGYRGFGKNGPSAESALRVAINACDGIGGNYYRCRANTVVRGDGCVSYAVGRYDATSSYWNHVWALASGNNREEATDNALENCWKRSKYCAHYTRCSWD